MSFSGGKKLYQTGQPIGNLRREHCSVLSRNVFDIVDVVLGAFARVAH